MSFATDVEGRAARTPIATEGLRKVMSAEKFERMQRGWR
jgi:hypothetical protein